MGRNKKKTKKELSAILAEEKVQRQKSERDFDSFIKADPDYLLDAIPMSKVDRNRTHVAQSLIRNYNPRGVRKSVFRKGSSLEVCVQYDNQAVMLNVSIDRCEGETATYTASLMTRDRSGDTREFALSSSASRSYRNAKKLLNTHSKKTGKFFKTPDKVASYS